MSTETIATIPATREFIAGAWRVPAMALGPWICNASTGQTLLAQVGSNADVVAQALDTAQRVHESGVWADLSVEQRAQCLERVADALTEQRRALAHVDALTTGVVCSYTEQFAALAPATFRAAAAQLRERGSVRHLASSGGDVEIHRLPLGPAAIIAPWNAPGVITAHKVASALAAGCPVIVKPSEWAPTSCTLLAEAIAAADLAPGVFQLVQGAADVGDALVRDQRIAAVSFTGGLDGGRAVAARCAAGLKPVQLELGGNNPLVVLEDADITAAAKGVVTALITLNGQWCRALGRLIVHEQVADQLLEQVLDHLAAITLGSALDPKSDMGPLIHAAHHQRVSDAVRRLQERGGTVHAPTPMPDLGGFFYPPTLVTGVAAEDSLDEIFGPVATVHRFRDQRQGLVLANQAPYGLAGYVFGTAARALAMARGIRAGDVKVNGVSVLGLHPLAPRPAWGLSGIGDEGTIETFEFFRGTRVVGAAGPSPEDNRA